MTPIICGRVRDYLRSIFDRCIEGGDLAWIDKHIGVLHSAFINDLAIAGSLAMAIGHQKPSKMPGDLDFVTSSPIKAMAFFTDIIAMLSGYRARFRIYGQIGTDWVPPGALAHYRLESSMFMKICVFVIPEEGMKGCWYRMSGLRVQNYNDVTKAVAAMRERDGKDQSVKSHADLIKPSEDPFRLMAMPDIGGEDPVDAEGNIIDCDELLDDDRRVPLHRHHGEEEHRASRSEQSEVAWMLLLGIRLKGDRRWKSRSDTQAVS